MIKANIFIKRNTQIKDIEDGDFIVGYNKVDEKVTLHQCNRSITFLHKHPYVEFWMNGKTNRYYDFDNQTLDLVKLEYIDVHKHDKRRMQK